MSKILAASKQVLTDCVLENGGITAVNTDKNYFFKRAVDYRYVWPRDASFIMYGLKELGVDATENFAKWLIERAESFHETGLSYRRYATHGACSYPDNEYQPDQTGELLWVLTAIGDTDSAVIKEAISVAADTLCRTWENDRFSTQTYDIWEQFANSEKHGSFVYSLAACSYGLQQASKLKLEDSRRWLEVAQQMKHVIEQSADRGFYTRMSLGGDDRLDASLLGLVWPFKVTGDEAILRKTVDEIEAGLLVDKGIMRFVNDRYDGVVKHSELVMQAAGPWPLLTCWYAIACHELGDTQNARGIFEKLTADLPDEYIPEQILPSGEQAVTPLGWAHAMYVIAHQRLGYSS